MARYEEAVGVLCVLRVRIQSVILVKSTTCRDLSSPCVSTFSTPFSNHRVDKKKGWRWNLAVSAIVVIIKDADAVMDLPVAVARINKLNPNSRLIKSVKPQPGPSTLLVEGHWMGLRLNVSADFETDECRDYRVAGHKSSSQAWPMAISILDQSSPKTHV